ncbi:MAG: BBP7 family outer membrane beta-barrel protein, partial [Gemmataceae bacterium]
MSRRFLSLIVFVALAGILRAQGELPAAPPLALPPTLETGSVPNGVLVSRPLQTEVAPSAPAAPVPIPTAPDAMKPEGVLSPDEILPAPQAALKEPRKGLPAHWDQTEFLFWWPKAQPGPVLLTGNRQGALPRTGISGTEVLIGGREIDDLSAGGLRLVNGWSLGKDNRAGLEFSFFLLGTRSHSALVADVLQPSGMVVGRPFVDATTGLNEVQPISVPGVGQSWVEAKWTSRLMGWEVLGVGQLWDGPWLRVNLTAGYRYFMVNESLRVEQTSVLHPIPTRPTIQMQVADQLDANNRFHGGQLGLNSEWHNDSIFLQIIGKVALGQSITVGRTSGQSNSTVAGTSWPLI